MACCVFVAMVLVQGLHVAALPPASSQPLVSAKVTRVAEGGLTCLLECKSPPPLGSRAWCFEGMRPTMLGQVVLRRGGVLGVAVEWSHDGPRVGQSAVIWTMPAGQSDAQTAVEAKWQITKVDAAGATVELAGAGEPLNVDDTLLAEQGGWPVARLIVTQVQTNLTQVTITPLVANARLKSGDTARRWPDAVERRTGRVRSRVLRIVEQGPDRELWIPWPDGMTARPGDRWEINRSGEYVGLAIVTTVTDLFVRATTNSALCRLPVLAGDEAMRRPAEDVMSGRTPLYVFRVEGPYGLVSGGEADGLRMGMPLLLMRGGAVAAALRINTINEDNCGVTLAGDVATTASAPVSTQSAATVEMRPWDAVYVKPPQQGGMGRVVRVWPDAGMLEIDYSVSPPRAGSRVRVGAGSNARMAVILKVETNRAIAACLDERAPGATTEGMAVETQVDD